MKWQSHGDLDGPRTLYDQFRIIFVQRRQIRLSGCLILSLWFLGLHVNCVNHRQSLRFYNLKQSYNTVSVSCVLFSSGIHKLIQLSVLTFRIFNNVIL